MSTTTVHVHTYNKNSIRNYCMPQAPLPSIFYFTHVAEVVSRVCPLAHLSVELVHVPCEQFQDLSAVQAELVRRGRDVGGASVSFAARGMPPALPGAGGAVRVAVVVVLALLDAGLRKVGQAWKR